MISVFDEASRDISKEQHERNVHMASSIVNSSVLPFVSSSRNKEQYEHYKALVTESIQSIASRCELSVEEVTGLLDQKMSYVFQAHEANLQAEGEAKEANSPKEHFYIVDGRNKRVGGSYSTKDNAQRSISKGEVKGSGLRVVTETMYQRLKALSGSKVDPFKALASMREALHEGTNPLDWVTDAHPPQTQEGTPSEHNSGPSSERTASLHVAEGPNVNSPVDPPQSAPTDTTMHENVPTPTAEMTGGTPTSNPAEQPRSMPNNPLGPSVSKIKEEIARYNPKLTEERIESIAFKVASRYFAEIEEEG